MNTAQYSQDPQNLATRCEEMGMDTAQGVIPLKVATSDKSHQDKTGTHLPTGFRSHRLLVLELFYKNQLGHRTFLTHEDVRWSR